jgi:uncharacterized protein (TIGR03067 family)
MRRATLLLASLLVLPLLGSGSPREYDDHTKTIGLEGTWQIVSINIAGQQSIVTKHCVQTFRDGKWFYSQEDGFSAGGTYTTDKSRSPAFLDETRMEPSPRTTKIIYRIDGATLQTAFSDANDGGRPTGFREEGIHIINWKRVSK